MGICSGRSGPPGEHPGPVIVKPDVPFKYMIPGGMFVGRLIRIRGYIKDKLQNIELKLRSSYHDDTNVALHICFRSADNYIVMNTIVKGTPGEEVAVGPVPLRKEQPFELFIICDPDDFQVIVNDMFTCYFPHRLKIGDVKYIAGEGDMRVTLISFESVKPRQSQIGMGSTMQFSSSKTGLQYSRESNTPAIQVRLDAPPPHLRNPDQLTNEPQQQQVQQNASVAPDVSSNAANRQSPFVISMPGNVPSTHDVSGGNANAPNSSGRSGTGTNVQR